jgi:RNA-directed DNA polymerase
VKWNQINWEQAEMYINRLQVRIVKATLEEKWRLVKRLQYLITHSFYGRAMAVKRVISNKGKNTPGIDGAVWKTDKEKEDAIRNLETKGFTASPLRRIYIEKFGKKEKRPLGIPTMFDRAMQSLQLLGLEPVAETKADTVSFGFRKYRGAFDAKEYTFSILCRKDSPQWILEGDIKGCFDNISHEWLTKNVTMDKKVLRQFIKSGFVFEDKLYPTNEGTPQGGIISPTLANLTLDGMEKLIKDIYWANAKGTVSVKNNKYKVHLIKYADDCAPRRRVQVA